MHCQATLTRSMLDNGIIASSCGVGASGQLTTLIDSNGVVDRRGGIVVVAGGCGMADVTRDGVLNDGKNDLKLNFGDFPVAVTR